MKANSATFHVSKYRNAPCSPSEKAVGNTALSVKVITKRENEQQCYSDCACSFNEEVGK